MNLEPFFEIPSHAGLAETLKYARDRLTTCQKDHPDCGSSLNQDNHLSGVPDYSIRILRICEDRLRLTPIKLRGALPPYVALSHCWGSSQTLKTLSTNIERFQNEIPLRSLPATFRDAIELTVSLGFDYIWIDSICIIQDSRVDWEEQSSLMAFVYGNADLVLAASRASSDNDGFLRERKKYRESSLQIRCVRDKNRALALKYRLLQPKDKAPVFDPLDRRAWAFQERTLARRYLAIGSHDTSWTCMTSLNCECEWWRVQSIWRFEILNINKAIRDAKDDMEELGRCWREKVLHHYCGRQLTFPSDNLVALSAIASKFHSKLGPDYCAGIWQGDLIHGLLWGCGREVVSYASDRSAPSWSWASMPTLEFGIFRSIGPFPQSNNLVKVLEAKTTPSTTNQFGSVCSGYIRLWGPLWRVEATVNDFFQGYYGRDHVLKVKGYLENEFMIFTDTSWIMTETVLSDGTEERSMRRVRRKEAQDTFYIGNLQGSKTVSLLMVPLLKESDGFHLNAFYGLILGRSQKDPAKFERVGHFITRNLNPVEPCEQLEAKLDESGEQEIVII